MSNLLKDASILLTPTAYDNGRMNATKPSKDLYGPELVTNGDFSQGSTGWTVQSGTVNITDKAEFVGSSMETEKKQVLSLTSSLEREKLWPLLLLVEII